MVNSFITVLNGVITGFHSGDFNADFFNTPYYGHERVLVPDNARVKTFDLVSYYDASWKRKPNVQLIDEGLLPMPTGYIREGDKLRQMTYDEKVAAGLKEPPEGHRVDEDGKVVEMSDKEKFEAGLITQEEYCEILESEADGKLNRLLSELQTPEALARTEVDGEYAAERKIKLAALLAVKQQPGWPLEVVWPE